MIIEDEFIEFPNKEDSPHHTLDFTSLECDFILECMQQFNDKKSQLFFNLHKVNEIRNVIFYIELAIRLFINYGNKWPLLLKDRGDVKLTKEIDPVVLITELKFLKENGVSTFEKINTSLTLLSNEFVHESSRLKIIVQDFLTSHPEFT